jgi:hypothetical protein
MDTETLHFKIGLSGTSAKHPEFMIKINDTEYFHSTLTTDPMIVEYFEFNAEVKEGEHSLSIILLNKESADTMKDNDGNIVGDLLLNIDSIEIDDIPMGKLLWTASRYFPNYPESYLDSEQKSIKEVKNCVNLGWNGIWQLPFTSPFYVWLLENL